MKSVEKKRSILRLGVILIVIMMLAAFITSCGRSSGNPTGSTPSKYTFTVNSEGQEAEFVISFLDKDGKKIALVSNRYVDYKCSKDKKFELSAYEIYDNGVDKKYKFKYWKKNGVKYSEKKSIDVTVIDNVTYTVVFEDLPVLTVNSEGHGASFEIVYEDQSGLHKDEKTETYIPLDKDQTVKLTATGQDTRAVFEYWKKNNNIFEESYNKTIDVTMTKDVTYTVVFKKALVLTIDIDGEGFVKHPDDFTNLIADRKTFDYYPGEKVELVAVKGSFEFKHWEKKLSNGKSELISKNITLPVTMATDMHIIAVFHKQGNGASDL